MSTLLELVVKNFPEWPQSGRGLDGIVQDGSGRFCTVDAGKIPRFLPGADGWSYYDTSTTNYFSDEVAEDYNSTVVTREVWEEARNPTAIPKSSLEGTYLLQLASSSRGVPHKVWTIKALRDLIPECGLTQAKEFILSFEPEVGYSESHIKGVFDELFTNHARHYEAVMQRFFGKLRESEELQTQPVKMMMAALVSKTIMDGDSTRAKEMIDAMEYFEPLFNLEVIV